MVSHLKENLEMTPLTSELACFIKIVQSNITRIIGTYVDDTTATGDISFGEEIKLTERTLEPKKRNYGSFVFVRIEIKTIQDKFLLNQSTYASKLQLLNFDCKIEEFKA